MSANVFGEDLHNTRDLQTTYYVTDMTQATILTVFLVHFILFHDLLGSSISHCSVWSIISVHDLTTPLMRDD